MSKAVSILIKWDNGEVWTAEGDDAAEIMAWYQACEGLNLVRGAQYRGPTFNIKQEKKP